MYASTSNPAGKFLEKRWARIEPPKGALHRREVKTRTVSPIVKILVRRDGQQSHFPARSWLKHTTNGISPTGAISQKPTLALLNPHDKPVQNIASSAALTGY
jgi:hypothetical protein